jgi:hypothetical protein
MAHEQLIIVLVIAMPAFIILYCELFLRRLTKKARELGVPEIDIQTKLPNEWKQLQDYEEPKPKRLRMTADDYAMKKDSERLKHGG